MPPLEKGGGAAFHLFQVEQKPCTLLGWSIDEEQLLTQFNQHNPNPHWK